MPVDVVCLGETMAVVAPDPPRPLDVARELRLGHAGAESNVAVALAGLGTTVRWCSRLGDDALGRRVLGEITAAGVDTGLVRLSAGRPTGVMFKDPAPGATTVLYYRSGSAAAAMDETDVDRAFADPPRLLHLTGITLALSATCTAAFEHAVHRAADAEVRMSFDVNHRSVLWPDVETAKRRLRDAAQRCDLVFVGMDEAARLWGTTTPADVRRCLDRSEVLVVKDGSAAAHCFVGDESFSVAAVGVDVVEPVGAGDAFAAGFLHAWLAGRSPVEALRLGHLVAAASLATTSDQGLLERPDVLLDRTRADAPWPPTFLHAVAQEP